MPKVSIIMPVYNAEKYVSEAIESVRNQSYSDWELLIVDDGSQDRSVCVVESYREKDNRIRLLQNTSGEHGPGAARNFGMEHVTGKYTYFLDADDWIDGDLLQDAVALAEKTGADIVPFGYVIEDRGKQIQKPLMPVGNFEYQDFKEAAYDIIRGTWSECHELIKSELLRGVRHNQYRKGEDICFQMDLLCRTKKVCGIEKIYYHYRVVRDSVSHSTDWYDQFMASNMAIWDGERRFLEYCGLSENSQIVKNAAIERYTWCILCLCEKSCSLTMTERLRQLRSASEQMNIGKYKRQFAWADYPGIRKIPKLLIKLNLESLILLFGTWYYKLCS